MQVKYEDRTLKFTNIPGIEGRLLEGLENFEVKVAYKGDTNVGTGVMLDTHIMPMVVQALDMFTCDIPVTIEVDEFVEDAATILANAWEFRGGRKLGQFERLALAGVIEQWFCDEAL